MSSPSKDSFVHLHVHTEYSMLDGAAKLPEVTAAAAAAGMPALAMTDHGNVFGAYDFYKQATKAGVKPIIGMEGYYTPGSRFDRAPFDFGDKLLDELHRQAVLRGVTEVELHAQVAARRFYERAGYTAVGEEYEEAGIRHVTMVKSL